MKNIFLGLLLAFIISNVDAFAQNPNWQWAKSAIGSGNEYGNDLSTDASGNIYITGDFSSSLVAFGSTTLANTTGSSDFFVTKYNSSGNVIWAKSAVGTATDTGLGVSSDALGNVIVIGNFQSPTLSFGAVTLTNFSNNLTSDVFIAKYDSSGTLIWAKSVSGSSNESAYNITTDSQGNIYISGYFSGNSILIGSYPLLNNVGNSLFLAKLDPAGNVLWAKAGSGSSYGRNVKVDAGGNVYLTGGFSTTPFTFGSISISSNGGASDLFLVKFDPLGNALWAKSAGGINLDAGTDIALNAAGEIYLTGITTSYSINFGTTTLTGMGNGTDSFIVKYDASGTVLWAKAISGFASQAITGISLDASNNPYVSGWFNSSSISFGTITYTNTGGSQPMFIASYDPAGNFTWANIIGGSGIDLAGNISIDPNGNAYLVGTFQSNLLTFGTSTLSNSGNSDVFLAKFNGYSPVGINEFDGNNFESTIFPNPFSIQTVLHVNEILNNATLTIRNCLGQIVKQTQGISGQKVAIFRDDLPEGIYYFNLYQGPKRIGTGKFVIANH